MCAHFKLHTIRVQSFPMGCQLILLYYYPSMPSLVKKIYSLMQTFWKKNIFLNKTIISYNFLETFVYPTINVSIMV